MPIAPSEERLALQELTHRYCFYCDTKQFDKLVQLFADNAVFDESAIGLPRTEGQSEIIALFETGLKQVNSIIHFVTNHLVEEYSADAASGICFFLCEVGYEDGKTARFRAYYDDRYTKSEGSWRFQSRRVVKMMPTQWGSDPSRL